MKHYLLALALFAAGYIVGLGPRAALSPVDAYIAQAKAYYAAKFNSDPAAAFAAYQVNGYVTEDGVYRFLTDAGVGNLITRGFIAREVVHACDTDADGRLTLDELKAGLAAHSIP